MEEQQVIKIGSFVNRYVWHYGTNRNKNGTYLITGLDFKKELKVGDVLESWIPPALFRILSEPTRSDSLATFEGIYKNVDPHGIRFSAICEFVQKKPIEAPGANAVKS